MHGLDDVCEVGRLVGWVDHFLVWHCAQAGGLPESIRGSSYEVEANVLH